MLQFITDFFAPAVYGEDIHNTVSLLNKHPFSHAHYNWRIYLRVWVVLKYLIKTLKARFNSSPTADLGPPIKENLWSGSFECSHE